MADHILKWRIPVDDVSHVIVGHRVLHTACQDPLNHGSVYVWVLASDEREDTLTVQVFPTGHQVPEGAEHLGTSVTANGHLVWHLFEVSKAVNSVASYTRPNRKRARNR